MTSESDKGWAWVVLVANVCTDFVVGLVIFSIGVFNVAVLDKFHEDVSTTAWAGAINISMSFLAAPLVIMIISKTNCRMTMLVGGLLLCIGHVTSAFVTSVWHLFFTYGLVAGTGHSASLNTPFLSIAFNFSRLRALAAGISQAGVPLGMLIGPLITQPLIDTYGLQGAFLLIGGICLHVCVFGCFVRPTSYETKTKENNPSEGQRGSVSCDNETQAVEYRNSSGDFEKSAENSEKFSKGTELSGEKHLETTPEYTNLPSEIENLTEASHQGNGVQETSKNISDYLNQEIAIVSTNTEAEAAATGPREETDPTSQTSKEENGDRNSDSSLFQKYNNSYGKKKGQNLTSKFRQKFLPLAKNFAFVSHCFGVLFTTVTTSAVFVHLVRYATTKGTPLDMAGKLFMGQGIVNLVACVVCGFLATGDRIHPLNISIVSLGVGGIVTALLPLYSHAYAGQMVFACLFGVVAGCFFSLINVLTLELVGMDLLPTALSVEGAFAGVGNLIGAPLAGLFVDYGGTYDQSFIFVGLSFVAASLLDILAKIFHRRRIISSEG